MPGRRSASKRHHWSLASATRGRSIAKQPRIVGITDWQKRKINGAADQDDVVRVTKLINGGTKGLDDRIKYLKVAKKIC